MNQFSGMNSLLALATASIDEATELDLYIGRSWNDTYRCIQLETLDDGLPRARMTELIRNRAFALYGFNNSALAAAEVVSDFAPLANQVEDIDAALSHVTPWLETLGTDDLFQRIIQLKKSADDIGLDEGPADASEEAQAAWNELFDAFIEDVHLGQIMFTFAGREILMTVEADATLVCVEREPQSGDIEVLVVFHHAGNDDDGSWGGDDDDDDPQPQLDPSRPILIDA